MRKVLFTLFLVLILGVVLGVTSFSVSQKEADSVRDIFESKDYKVTNVEKEEEAFEFDVGKITFVTNTDALSVTREQTKTRQTEELKYFLLDNENIRAATKKPTRGKLT